MKKKIFQKGWGRIKDILSGPFWYARDLLAYRKLARQAGATFPLRLFPQIMDKSPSSHTFDKHYVYMDRWAAGQLLKHKPELHVDVGSSLRFVSFATLITRVKFVDIRPVQTDFENYECVEGNILSLPFETNSLTSVSCLHVAEHIGLGRYGDPLDVWGTKKACAELARVLKPGGRLYFAGPIGKNAVYFNAHRVHAPSTISQYFSGLKLVEFAAVTDAGRYLPLAKSQDFENADYACGCFVFTKPE